MQHAALRSCSCSCALALVAMVLCATMMGTAGNEPAPASPPPPARRPHVPPQRIVDGLVRDLATEAEAAREAGRFEHPKPDIAARFKAEQPDVAAPNELLLQAMFERQHPDPFVDAYIRWQLTSFDPAWPEVSDRGFLIMLNAAPGMVEYPKANQSVIMTMRQVERAGAIAPADIEAMQRALAELDTQTIIAEEMNRPAIEFRAWVAKHLGDTGIRPRLWLLENLRAMITAGWPVSTMKGNITRNFTDSINDETFTPQHRQFVVDQMRQLIGLRRDYLDEVTVYASRQVKPSIYGSYVSEENVENWHKRLMGIR